MKWPGVLKGYHFEIVRTHRNTFEQPLTHWTTVNRGYNHFRENKKPKTISSRTQKFVAGSGEGFNFISPREAQGNNYWSFTSLNDIKMTHKVKYEVILWRNLSRIFLLWLSFTLSEFNTVHSSSQKNQEIKILPFSKKTQKR